MKRIKYPRNGYLVLVACLVILLCAGAAWWHIHRPSPGLEFPVGIVIHHTATPPVVNGKKVDVAYIDAMHEKREFYSTGLNGRVYHIGYHYLIQQDGAILRGRPEYLHGAHTVGHNDMLGIALVGDFEPSDNLGLKGPMHPTPAQLASAIRLTRILMARYHLPRNTVFLHRELAQTACPGSGFPRERFLSALAKND